MQSCSRKAQATSGPEVTAVIQPDNTSLKELGCPKEEEREVFRM